MAVKTIVSDAGKFSYDRFHFAEATSHNGFLFCSGIIGTDAKGKLPDDVKEEFRNAWRGVAKLLAEAGSGEAHIMEYTTYHVGLQAHMADFMSVRDEFLSEPWPAWTAIGITELAVPGAHVEIRVTAAIPD
jgi:enamine deaminase RidA (YjgF/YER057c/UK114 family)